MTKLLLTHNGKLPTFPTRKILVYKIQDTCSNLTLVKTITNVSCYGGSNGGIDINPIVSPPNPDILFEYLWTGPNGFSSTTQDLANIFAGTYSIKITETIYGVPQCSYTENIIVNQPTAITMTYSISYSGGLGSIDLSVQGGSVPYRYEWIGTGGFYATTQDISSLSTGTYSCFITDNNDCQISTGDIFIN